ncbi:hypothetical protein ABPG72_013901 [Tetrahymena utriculariae]
MANLYECQIAQLKAQLQNKNEIIQVKYQENKFFLNQIQDLENSFKKSPYRKEDKGPIGHVAPFCQVPEKQLKKLNQNSENNFLQLQNKKEEDYSFIKKNNEEEHLDESEETSNIKQSNMIAQKQDKQLTEEQLRQNAIEEELVKQKLLADQNSPQVTKKNENQPVIPVFMTYQEYNQRMSKDNKSRQQENQKTTSKLQNNNCLQSEEQKNQNDTFIEKQESSKSSKNQYSPVIKREDQIQQNLPPFQENKIMHYVQDQEEDFLLNKQQNISQQNLNADIQRIQDEDNLEIEKNNCQISKSILDKYNDYLQGEKLYMEEDSMNYQQRNHILSTIKEEQLSEHQTNFSSVYQNQNNSQSNEVKPNQTKKNTIKNYSNYIENLKMNLKQSQEQRKQLEEQVNNIIKTSNSSFKEDYEDKSYLDVPLNQQMGTFGQDTIQNQGIAVQIKLSGDQGIQSMEQNQVKEKTRQPTYNYEWDSDQIPQLEEEEQTQVQNQIVQDQNQEQIICNYNLNQDDRQQIKNTKYKYEDEIPVNHSTFQNQTEYEKQYQEILNQQNVIKQQFKFLK